MNFTPYSKLTSREPTDPNVQGNIQNPSLSPNVNKNGTGALTAVDAPAHLAKVGARYYPPTRQRER